MELAERFAGLRIVHVNSTANCVGVAEILHSLVPLSNALGMHTERAVIVPKHPDFFTVTKRIHNMLQGAEGELSATELDSYYNCLDEVSGEIGRTGLSADVWFLHNPQLLPLATAYDALICSLGDYVPSTLHPDAGIHIAPPAIDPLNKKNDTMPPARARQIVEALAIDPNRPLVTQVSRFDCWKDPSGVVDACRLTRRSNPGLQMALFGLSQANHDPDGIKVLGSVHEYAAGEPHIHLFFDPDGLPASDDEIVNTLQTHSDVLLQKSTSEGFGLTVSEGMWKGKPVVGGNVGGIRLQIEDGESGFLVDFAEEAGERVAQLLADPELRADIGRNAKGRVRDNFLMPRLLYDYMDAARQARNLA